MSSHVCDGVHGKRRVALSSRKHRKERPEINSSNCGLFTCGGCHTKFRTICCLHVHIDKHQEGGSYTFDHVTKTAFPKYDSTCSFTQVESKFFEMISGSFIRTETLSISTQTIDEELETEHAEDRLNTRRSKRIAKRNFNTDKVKSNKKMEADAILEVKKRKHRKSVNSLETAPHFLAANDLASVKQKRKSNIKIEKFSTKKKKQKKQDQSKVVVGSTSEHSKDSNLQGALNLSIGTEEPNTENDNMCITLDSFENMNPKTDEIAASEALLAISKSAEGENQTNKSDMVNAVISDNEKDLDETSESKGNDFEEGIRDTGVLCSNMNKQEEAYVKFLEAHKKDYDDDDDDDDDYESFLLAQSKKETYKCPTCGKDGSRAMISYHKHLHKEQKELSCDVCGKLFQHPSCLKVHLRCHTGRMFPCHVCGSKFSRKNYLETHMLKHTGEKPYMCETCGKGYRDSNHLKRHIKHVHDKKRDFECDICQERFFRSDHLKCHRMRHFGPGHRCQFCKKMFKVKFDLERHMKTHTEEKKWFCLICGHGFRYPVPYYNHMSKKHEIERSEAEVLRKKQMEGNRKAPHQLYIVQNTLVPTNDNTDIREDNIRDEMNVTSIELSSKPAVVPTVRKIFIRENHMFSESGDNADNVNNKAERGSYEFNNKSKEVRVASVVRTSNPRHDSTIDFDPIGKGYEIVSMGNKPENKAVHVLSNLTQETTSLQQGLTFALQNALSEEEIDGTREGGIVGYGEGDHLQGDQLVVMAEETVVDDINMMSENTQAVIFLDDNNCPGKNISQNQL